MNPFRRNKYLKVIYPFVILAIGIGVYTVMVKNRQAPVKVLLKESAPIVRVVTARSSTHRVVVRGTGTVRPKQEITIVPQVSGVVTYAHPELSIGAFFKKGELLFEIEDTDYKLAIDRAEASKARAEYEVIEMESRARVARLEWERFDKENTKEPAPLLLYTPQLKNARASLKAAEASLEEARLNLGRSKIYAPFNCRVRTEAIDIGQYVRAGTVVMDISGTDASEVFVSLPLKELKWILIPSGNSAEEKASEATVTLRAGEDQHMWKGKVVRSTGEINPKDRMARVVVSVKSPYALNRAGSVSEKNPIKLQEGAFVEVSIKGTKLHGVFKIKRSALREGDTLWVAGTEGRLSIRNVKIARKGRDEVIITGGIRDGEEIITTFISAVTDKMKISVRKGDDK